MRDASLAGTLNAVLVDIDRTSDAELIGRFIAAKDDSAFELLLRRHADLVSNVCRSILREDFHAAEDAFQATFIVLARHASALSNCESLGAWLFSVARHAAMRVRKGRSKRAWEPLRGDIPSSESTSDASLEIAERASLLAEEVDRLPARYRIPVILCFYRGLTHVQASLELGWSIGTVASRIARAKDRLRNRLTRRGVLLGSSIASTIGVLQSHAASACLIRSCAPFAIDGNSSSKQLNALSNEVITTMRRIKRKWLLAAPLAAIGISLGVVLGGSMANETPPLKTSETQKVELDDPIKGLHDIFHADPKKMAGLKERSKSKSNLDQIAQAIITYQTVHGHLPTDIVDKNGKALLSWRVALLPYLEQRNIYKCFKLDEPWDSEHNARFGWIIVKLFMGGVEPNKAPIPYGLTYVKRFTGPNTLHQPGEKVDLQKMLDKEKPTLLLAEVGEPIPWTKPGDPTIVPKDPPVWTGPYSNVVNAVFVCNNPLSIRPDIVVSHSKTVSLKPDLPGETVASLIYANKNKELPNLDSLNAVIQKEQESNELMELENTYRQMTDRMVKLSDEERNLKEELTRLGKRARDPEVFAGEVLKLERQLRDLQTRVKDLKEEIEKTKKEKSK
jgi:RNA polymerase sigma factor (sigma-70 family)